MKTIKEVLEIAKKHHRLWNPDSEYFFMCHAVDKAYEYGEVTSEEASQATGHIMGTISAIGQTYRTIADALDMLPLDPKVKEFWEDHINSMKN